jgi:hypothetical protein
MNRLNKRLRKDIRLCFLNGLILCLGFLKMGNLLASCCGSPEYDNDDSTSSRSNNRNYSTVDRVSFFKVVNKRFLGVNQFFLN